MAPDPKQKHVAVCPGSYDPITYGHVDVISRAAEIFDELIVSVVNASVRKDRVLFPAEERVRFIEHATAHLPGASHHDRGRTAPQRRHPPHHALRHRYGQMHLLRPLPGGLPGGRHR